MHYFDEIFRNAHFIVLNRGIFNVNGYSVPAVGKGFNAPTLAALQADVYRKLSTKHQTFIVKIGSERNGKYAVRILHFYVKREYGIAYIHYFPMRRRSGKERIYDGSSGVFAAFRQHQFIRKVTVLRMSLNIRRNIFILPYAVRRQHKIVVVCEHIGIFQSRIRRFGSPIKFFFSAGFGYLMTL